MSSLTVPLTTLEPRNIKDNGDNNDDDNNNNNGALKPQMNALPCPQKSRMYRIDSPAVS